MHLDLVGPLPSAGGQRYLLTMLDRWTRWPEAIPLATATAENVTAAFLLHWVARFGAPQYVTTDRGSVFTSHLFRSTLSLLGTKAQTSTAYHPQTSGILERWHRPLKAAMMCHEDDSWLAALPWVLLGLRSALKDDLQASVADLVYGEPLRLPGELLSQGALPPPAVEMPGLLARIRRQVERMRPVPASRHGQRATFVFPALADATHVFLRDDTVRAALQQPYKGPLAVLGRTDKTVRLQLPGREDNVAVDRVKPAFRLADDAAPHLGADANARGPPPYAPTAPAASAAPTAPAAPAAPGPGAPYRTRAGRVCHPVTRN